MLSSMVSKSKTLQVILKFYSRVLFKYKLFSLRQWQSGWHKKDLWLWWTNKTVFPNVPESLWSPCSWHQTAFKYKIAIQRTLGNESQWSFLSQEFKLYNTSVTNMPLKCVKLSYISYVEYHIIHVNPRNEWDKQKQLRLLLISCPGAGLEPLRGIFPRQPNELLVLCFETRLVFLDLEELFYRWFTRVCSRSHHQ